LRQEHCRRKRATVHIDILRDARPVEHGGSLGDGACAA